MARSQKNAEIEAEMDEQGVCQEGPYVGVASYEDSRGV